MIAVIRVIANRIALILMVMRISVPSLITSYDRGTFLDSQTFCQHDGRLWVTICPLYNRSRLDTIVS